MQKVRSLETKRQGLMVPELEETRTMTPDDFELWQQYKHDDEQAQLMETLQKFIKSLPEMVKGMYPKLGLAYGISGENLWNRYVENLRDNQIDSDADPDPNFDKWFLQSCGIAPLE